MEEFLYVQINNERLAIGFSQLSGEVDAPNMIRVSDHGEYLGKKWTGAEWEDVPVPEPQPPEPTQEELNNLALMEGIAGLYETQVALEDRMTTDNITVMEGLAGLFEAQMGGV